MQAVDLYDEITLEKSDMIEMICDDPNLPVDSSNLAVKAAQQFQEKFYFPGVRIELKKHIPYGSGLGGGSSDAAFVLRGLCALYGLTPNPREINQLASEIGSDVPFFLGTGQARVAGRGEIVKRIKLPRDYEIAILAPPVKISTAEAYAGVKNGLTYIRDRFLFTTGITFSRFKEMLARFHNDLEEVVFSNYPELGNLKNFFYKTGAIHALMTGSGSAIYGVFVSGGRDKIDFKGELKSDIGVYFCRPIVLSPLLS